MSPLLFKDCLNTCFTFLKTEGRERSGDDRKQPWVVRYFRKVPNKARTGTEAARTQLERSHTLQDASVPPLALLGSSS